jgi:hypothetical protein
MSGPPAAICPANSEPDRVGPVAALLRICSLSLVLGGEGWGEGRNIEVRNSENSFRAVRRPDPIKIESNFTFGPSP